MSSILASVRAKYSYLRQGLYIRLGGKGVNFGICLSALGVSYVMKLESNRFEKKLRLALPLPR